MAKMDQDFQKRLMTLLREWLVENEAALPPEAMKLATDLHILARHGVAWGELFKNDVSPHSVVLFYMAETLRQNIAFAMEGLANELDRVG